MLSYMSTHPLLHLIPWYEVLFLQSFSLPLLPILPSRWHLTPAKTVIPSFPEDQTSSPVMERIGQWVRGLLVKFWIWLVAIMLFIFGIQGSEVVIFRIMYMVLFLIFTITFQVSLHVLDYMYYKLRDLLCSSFLSFSYFLSHDSASFPFLCSIRNPHMYLSSNESFFSLNLMF